MPIFQYSGLATLPADFVVNLSIGKKHFTGHKNIATL
jgi:hypothetical protein